MDKIPFEGFISDYATEHGVAATTSGFEGVNGYEYSSQVTKFYSHDQDPTVIDILGTTLIQHVVTTKPPYPALILNVCDESELCARLRRVSQYKDASIGIDNVCLSDNLSIIQRYVKEYKYIQIRKFISVLSMKGVDLFYPQRVILKDGTDTTVAPPIIEANGNSMILIDGHTRILHCLKNNINSIRAIVVRDVTAPLPDQPRRLSDLTFMPGTFQIQDNVDKFNSANFRYIEEYIH